MFQVGTVSGSLKPWNLYFSLPNQTQSQRRRIPIHIKPHLLLLDFHRAWSEVCYLLPGEILRSQLENGLLVWYFWMDHRAQQRFEVMCGYRQQRHNVGGQELQGRAGSLATGMGSVQMPCLLGGIWMTNTGGEKGNNLYSTNAQDPWGKAPPHHHTLLSVAVCNHLRNTWFRFKDVQEEASNDSVL